MLWLSYFTMREKEREANWQSSITAVAMCKKNSFIIHQAVGVDVGAQSPQQHKNLVGAILPNRPNNTKN